MGTSKGLLCIFHGYTEIIRILLHAADVDGDDFGLAGFGPFGRPGQ